MKNKGYEQMISFLCRLGREIDEVEIEKGRVISASEIDFNDRRDVVALLSLNLEKIKLLLGNSLNVHRTPRCTYELSES